MKLTVVGGGSTYTPELIDGFARLRDTLPVEELVLVDPAADRLDLVGGLARRMPQIPGGQPPAPRPSNTAPGTRKRGTRQ
ncbi:glycosyl hydrolase family 4 [Streptomyces sp. SLBN-115]|nr:glycosyl hydrolase family 4 [Streptomyces sp. SLBN-115]